MATLLADRPMPVLASGQPPRPDMAVITFDGHRGTVLWTTPGRVLDPQRRTWREADRMDPDYWKTLVRLEDGRAYRYITKTLKAVEVAA